MHVTCSRRHDNKASVSRHNAAAAAAPSPSLDSTNHVDASLKTCVESLSAVRRLHKDLASHIEVSDAYIVIIILSVGYTRTLLVTSRSQMHILSLSFCPSATQGPR